MVSSAQGLKSSSPSLGLQAQEGYIMIKQAEGKEMEVEKLRAAHQVSLANALEKVGRVVFMKQHNGRVLRVYKTRRD